MDCLSTECYGRRHGHHGQGKIRALPQWPWPLVLLTRASRPSGRAVRQWPRWPSSNSSPGYKLHPVDLPMIRVCQFISTGDFSKLYGALNCLHCYFHHSWKGIPRLSKNISALILSRETPETRHFVYQITWSATRTGWPIQGWMFVVTDNELLCAVPVCSVTVLLNVFSISKHCCGMIKGAELKK